MPSNIIIQSPLQHQQVEVEGASIHVVEGGAANKPTVLFLHGWPESWATFEQVMSPLSTEAHVVAIDLPGVGASEVPPRANDKRTLAKYVHGVITKLALQNVTLVGHDAGGMIVYAYLHAYPETLQRAVIMNVVIPGIDPWSEVVANPHIWHFAFHSIPKLPEALVADRLAAYFDYFYDQLSGPAGVGKAAREIAVQAYARPEALHIGFEWYRAFPQDEKDNLAVKGNPIQTPVLYLRGEREQGDIEHYVSGLRSGGLLNVQGLIIPNSGHFMSEEQPEALLTALQAFLNSSDPIEPANKRSSRSAADVRGI
jgi:pimeloyl-ACP methyl ester carboxylesterase